MPPDDESKGEGSLLVSINFHTVRVNKGLIPVLDDGRREPATCLTPAAPDKCVSSKWAVRPSSTLLNEYSRVSRSVGMFTLVEFAGPFRLSAATRDYE
jgi:hypothetical protein